MFKGKDIISTKNLNRDEIEYIIDKAEKFEPIAEGKEYSDILKEKVLGLAFFQPSTRTKYSFELAMRKLGGIVTGFGNPSGTSIDKGESLEDTVKVLETYSDLLVIRHPKAGVPAEVANLLDIPVINGGDNSNQHPTQALLDIYTIKKEKKEIDGLKIAFVSDVSHSRTVKSLTYALSNYDVQMYFVGIEKYQIPDDMKRDLEKRDIKISQVESIRSIVSEVDFIYSEFRGGLLLDEKYENKKEREYVKEKMFIDKKILEDAKQNLKIMHPLPRYEELSVDIDNTPHALYFEQAKNGIPIRMALLSSILGKG